VFKCVHGSAPPYLADEFSRPADSAMPDFAWHRHLYWSFVELACCLLSHLIQGRSVQIWKFSWSILRIYGKCDFVPIHGYQRQWHTLCRVDCIIRILYYDTTEAGAVTCTLHAHIPRSHMHTLCSFSSSSC